MALPKTGSEGGSKKMMWVVLVIVVIAIIAGVCFAMNWWGGDQSPYSAVYLNTGDIYFGKLHMFPKPYLTDVLYLQRGTNAQGQAQVGLSSFSSAFWGPSDVIYINPSQIEFWAPLRKDSQLIPVLENPASLNQAANNAGAQQQPANPAPSDTGSTTPSQGK